jgi:hypothetical protein
MLTRLANFPNDTTLCPNTPFKLATSPLAPPPPG